MAAAPEQLELDAARSETEALYREHGAAVFRICRAVLRDRHDAEDATQQVFLSAHRALLGGAVPREPLAWLATIARRECWARSAANGSAPEPEASLTAPDAAAEAIRKAEVAALWLAIAELPPVQREALLLREIRGLSYVQLGDELSLSPPATRSLLSRARRSIRLRLRDLHTAVGGASWIEALVRLFAGGANPAAPAARAAALGLGAAAIAGGAVVTPTVLQHHVRRPVAIAKAVRPARVVRHVTHRVVHVTPVRAAVDHAPVVRTPVVTFTSRHTSPSPRRATHVEHRRSSPSRSEGHDDHAAPVTSRSGEGSTPASSSSDGDRGSSGGEATPAVVAAPTVAFEASGHDGESSGHGERGASDGGSHDGQGGSGGESGDGGSGSSD